MRRSSSIGVSAAIALVVPEGPAVAGVQPLHLGADLVDRTGAVADRQRAVGAHLGGPALLGVIEHGAGLHQAGVDQADEGDARLGALAGEHGEIGAVQRPRPRRCARRRRRYRPARARCRRSGGQAAWPPRRWCRSRRTDRARHRRAWSRPVMMRCEQRFRLLRRMQLVAVRRSSAARRRCRSGTASRSASGCRRSTPSALRS